MKKYMYGKCIEESSTVPYEYALVYDHNRILKKYLNYEDDNEYIYISQNNDNTHDLDYKKIKLDCRFLKIKRKNYCFYDVL